MAWRNSAIAFGYGGIKSVVSRFRRYMEPAAGLRGNDDLEKVAARPRKRIYIVNAAVPFPTL